MKKINLFILLLIFMISILFIGCPIQTDSNSDNGNDKKEKNDDSNNNTHVPGSNLPSSITNSTPLTLPSGVTINKMNGGTLSLISTFPVSLILTNNTSTTYNYTFNAGSNFWADTEEAQNLIIVWDVSITINPGNNSSIILPTFCINPSLSAPGIYDNYCLGTIYTDGCMGQIINILSTKIPSTFDYFDLTIIQAAIAECLANGTLSTTTINLLNAL